MVNLGGGPAGLFAAIRHKQLATDEGVLLLNETKAFVTPGSPLVRRKHANYVVWPRHVANRLKRRAPGADICPAARRSDRQHGRGRSACPSPALPTPLE